MNAIEEALAHSHATLDAFFAARLAKRQASAATCNPMCEHHEGCNPCDAYRAAEKVLNEAIDADDAATTALLGVTR